jgi:hypothetical protein
MNMTKSYLRRPIPVLLTVALLVGLALSSSALGRSSASSTKLRTASEPIAHSSSTFMTGIGDEQTEMFSDPHWQQLHTRISRYIAPYDVAYDSEDLAHATEWIHEAEAEHQQILIAFYHSERTPTKMPSLAIYQRDVKRFMQLFPEIKQYQPWNEANRGNVAHMFDSPTAVASAQYYQVLKRACHSCTIVGLDILDQANVYPTLVYIAQFKAEIRRLETVMPSVWGLHNYSDTNRDSTMRTRAVLAAVPGQVWLTETGGIVKFGPSFPNNNGSGLKRAASALSFMFKIAASNPRITRLYIFQWTGSTASARFDAGLTDAHYKPRPGYLVVCHQLHAAHCNVTLSKH